MSALFISFKNDKVSGKGLVFVNKGGGDVIAGYFSIVKVSDIFCFEETFLSIINLWFPFLFTFLLSLYSH